MNVRNVYLVGMMAVGKTTVGRHLASLIGFTFHDTDRVIEQRAGADISWIFELEGEERFRDREQQVIEEMTQRQGIVLATGGGAVLRARNRILLRERGVVVYLRSGIDLIIERTRDDRRRPLLQVDDVREQIESLTAETRPDLRSRRPPGDHGRPPAAQERRRRHRATARRLRTVRRRRDRAGRPEGHVVNERIEVALTGGRSYPILLGDGLLGTPDLLDPFTGTQALIVTNAAIASLYLDDTRRSLLGVDQIDVVEIGDGETFKTLDTYATVLDALVENRHNRTTTVVALGGGVVGDVAGLPPPPITAAWGSYRSQPRCWPSWIPRWAARRPSTIPRART